MKRKNILEWAKELNISGFSKAWYCESADELWASYELKSKLNQQGLHLFFCEHTFRVQTLNFYFILFIYLFQAK